MHPGLRRAIEGGPKKDYGTCDAREPEAVRRKRSIVNPPTEKLGRKLLLDTR
jgi:hypothetical protein